MTDVVVFPQSGYANRLQAMASAAVLADALGARWYVCWEAQPVAPIDPALIFDAGLIDRHFVSSAEAEERWGLVKTQLPLYLTEDWVQGRVIVAGHERGEQSLMPGLRDLLHERSPAVIAIVGGGKYFLPGDAVLTTSQAQDFRGQRELAYRLMVFSPEVEDAAASVLERHGPFIGLHLRYSDRSLESPWRRAIWPAVRKTVMQTGITDVFVASDTSSERERWQGMLAQRDLHPWTVRPESSDRSDPASALGALIDWRILSRSSAMVYFSASSFAEEAAVASGNFDRGVGLPPSRSRAVWVRAREYAHAAATYPARHGWWSTTKEQ